MTESRVSRRVATGIAILLIAEAVIVVVRMDDVDPEPAPGPTVPPEIFVTGPLTFCDVHVVPLGYACEEYKVQTDDGFILVLHRLSKWYSMTSSATTGSAFDPDEPAGRYTPEIPKLSPQSISSGDRQFGEQSPQAPVNDLKISKNRRQLFRFQGSVTATDDLNRHIDKRGKRRISNRRVLDGSTHDAQDDMMTMTARGHRTDYTKSIHPDTSNVVNVNYRRRSNLALERVPKHGTHFQSDIGFEESAGQSRDFGEFGPVSELERSEPSPKALERYALLEMNYSSHPSSTINVTQGTEPALPADNMIDFTTATSTSAISAPGEDQLSSSPTALAPNSGATPYSSESTILPVMSLDSSSSLSPNSEPDMAETHPSGSPRVLTSTLSPASISSLTSIPDLTSNAPGGEPSPAENALSLSPALTPTFEVVTPSGIDKQTSIPVSSPDILSSATTLSPLGPGSTPSATPESSTAQSASFSPIPAPPYASPVPSPNNDLPLSGPDQSSIPISEEQDILSPTTTPSTVGRIRRSHCHNHCRGVPVLLMHPEFLNGDSWFVRVDSPTDQLLPFVLVDAGYDVWVGHQRATFWGHDHARLESSDSSYWEWTWDEHAEYDIPALLGFINKETDGHDTIHYIGVSQSATAGAAAATSPQVATLLKSMTLLGPTIYRGNTNSVVLNAWAYIVGNILDERFYDQANNHGMFNYSELEYPFYIISGQLRMQGPLSVALASISGPNCCLGSTVFESHNGWDGTTSYKNIIHFEQGVRRNLWQRFVYENDQENIQAYNGKVFPPFYNPADIPARIPIFVIYGEQDMAAPSDGVREFLSLLEPGQAESLYLRDYGHFDLTSSVNRTDVVYGPILQFLKSSSR